MRMVSATVHTSIVYGVLAFLYGFVVYVAKHAQSQLSSGSGVKFEPRKLFRTVIVGVVVGVYAAVNGNMSAAGINNILPYAIPIADQIVKVVWNYLGLNSVLAGIGVGQSGN